MKETTINLDLNNSQMIYSQLWETETQTKGVLVLVHGFGEHSGRYSNHFAEHFLNKGFSIVTFDLPGHGKSGGKRGHIGNAIDISALVSSGIKYAKRIYPDLPTFLYGHSFGGMIVLWYAIQSKPDLNGVISTSPLLRLHDPVPPNKLALVRIMNKILPSHIVDNDLRREMLSRDKQVINQYNIDPLVHGDASVRSGMFILEKGRYVSENAKKLDLPTLVMVGSADKIVSVPVIHDFCRQAKNCKEKIWDKLFHEIHNEPEKENVMQFASKWLSAHM